MADVKITGLSSQRCSLNFHFFNCDKCSSIISQSDPDFKEGAELVSVVQSSWDFGLPAQTCNRGRAVGSPNKGVGNNNIQNRLGTQT